MDAHRQSRREYWNKTALLMDRWSSWGRYYHQRLAEIYQFLIPPGQKVLELGCGHGDLLAALRPSVGVGVDLSPEMITRAGQRHPDLTFVCADAHSLVLDEKFDFIILSDLVNDLWDLEDVFNTCARMSHSRTRLVLNTYSRLWELPLRLARFLGLAKPTLDQNWLTVEDVANLLYLGDFQVLRTWSEILWPLRTLLVDRLLNRFLVRLWPFNQLAMTNFVIARPIPAEKPRKSEPSVSVIIPARNEAGNIPQIFLRVPAMGSHTELVFIEGHSRDDTYAAIEQAMAANPSRASRLMRQEGVGKGDAVRLGFAHAQGDILMILDSDLTVAPEDLPRFYHALVSGKGEFINGVRLVYPMEKQAMRFLNMLGNKFFSLAFSWLLGQSVKDSLCGTKVLWKSDYDQIAANRSFFGDFDPFGDFDLLFGAAKLTLKIVDLPIHYHERTYGTTNIQRWKHGWLLLRMVVFAALRIKFT